MSRKTVCLLACLVACAFGYRLRQAPPDLSTPKATVRTFIEALSRQDAKTLALCVEGGVARQEAMDMLFGGQEGPKEFRAQTLIAEIEGDNAKVAADFEMDFGMRAGGIGSTLALTDLLTLKKTGEEWRIVPDSKSLSSGGAMAMGGHPLRLFAAFFGADETVITALKAARAKAQEVACLSNAKQIGLGMLMYTQDYDEVLPRKSANYKDLIFPYIKSEDVFRCALDAKGIISYRYNINLAGKPMAAILDPTRTVLLYEGKGSKPDFRHEGRAAIVLADGHAKMMTEEELKPYYWYAGGAKPDPNPPARPRTKPKGKTNKPGKK